MSKNFYDWCEFLHLLDEGVQTMRKPHPKKSDERERDFLVLFGNTMEVKDDLKKLNIKYKLGKGGFKYYQGTWSIAQYQLDKNPGILSDLTELGVDLSGYESGLVGTTAQPTPPKSDEGKPQSPADEILDTMSDKLAKASANTQDRQISGMLDFIQDAIENLSKMTDEAAKSDFVRQFLAFSAKFHNYSFYNQMLIYVQNPNASYVNSEKRWATMGRFIDQSKRKLAPKEGGPIAIIVPMPSKIKDKETGDVKIDPDTGEEMKRMFFGTGKVWDISSTYVAPGMEDKAKVFEPNDWRQDTNENREEITVMIEAGIALARSMGINVSTEKLGHAGGYSAGGKIVLNSTYDGINKFSTLVHELAHEILHQNIDRDERMRSTRAQKEHDAESTAYVVLNYYGFETKDAARYLALWKADKESIKLRADHIQKAAKQIIEGINKQMQAMNLDFGDDEEQPAAQGAAQQSFAAYAQSRDAAADQPASDLGGEGEPPRPAA